MNELKPCPLCGGSATKGMFSVWCVRCGNQTPEDVDITSEEIIKKWNTRPIEDALRSHVEELTTALENRMPEAERRIAELEKAAKEQADAISVMTWEKDRAMHRATAAEERLEKYKALDDPRSDDAFAAIVLYIQTHFDVAKQDRLVRYFVADKYLGAEGQVKELVEAWDAIPDEDEIKNDEDGVKETERWVAALKSARSLIAKIGGNS